MCVKYQHGWTQIQSTQSAKLSVGFRIAPGLVKSLALCILHNKSSKSQTQASINKSVKRIALWGTC